jgi:hypothetical protein
MFSVVFTLNEEGIYSLKEVENYELHGNHKLDNIFTTLSVEKSKFPELIPSF